MNEINELVIGLKMKQCETSDGTCFDNFEDAVKHQKELNSSDSCRDSSDLSDNKNKFEMTCPIIQKRFKRIFAIDYGYYDDDGVDEDEEFYDHFVFDMDELPKRYFKEFVLEFFDSIGEIKESATEEGDDLDSINDFLEGIYDLDREDWCEELQWDVNISVDIEYKG